MLVFSFLVVFWCGEGFYCVVWMNLWYGVILMDIFISFGFLVLLGWFVWVLMWGSVGYVGMCYCMIWVLECIDFFFVLYLEVLVGVIIFIFIGWWIEVCNCVEVGLVL